MITTHIKNVGRILLARAVAKEPDGTYRRRHAAYLLRSGPDEYAVDPDRVVWMKPMSVPEGRVRAARVKRTGAERHGIICA